MDKSSSSQEPPGPDQISSFKQFLSSLHEQSFEKYNEVGIGVLTKGASKALLIQIENTMSMIDNIEKEMKAIKCFSSNKM
jgi:hypothetical protein